HLLAQLAFHGGLDLEILAGGDVDVDEHHTVEDVLAALGDALADALAGREGVTRYGSATVPMDEARATAAVDLVRRPHAEVALAFAGDRVGGLPLTLLPHALERFAVEAGLTLHVESAGADDHHVAEAAFKAVGRALRERIAAGRPVLGICLGMQLLFEESEEGGCGLGVLRGPVRRLRVGRVPHMGWNTLQVTASSALLEGLDGADVYFAHSFACAPA